MVLHDFLPGFLIQFDGIIFQKSGDVILHGELQTSVRIAAHQTGFVKHEISFGDRAGKKMLNGCEFEGHEQNLKNGV